ncbi:unnamed protein product [Fraxinus pennsylvanica]|uniref:Uncharacterized protein n=1 Tax=Fraxinus pennsylvanica TaxID=56036 RepID=A0AAD2E5B9_9LAMI|nr:unnamed protein product [Fraxinus pennsylvanica]
MPKTFVPQCRFNQCTSKGMRVNILPLQRKTPIPHFYYQQFQIVLIQIVQQLSLTIKVCTGAKSEQQSKLAARKIRDETYAAFENIYPVLTEFRKVQQWYII